VSAGSSDGGGDAVPLSFGPAVKRTGQGSTGGRRHCGGGKKNKLPPAPYLYQRGRSWGSWGVFHYHDRFCHKAPRGGTEWGSGSCNRAMTQ
jgi:hypothetical protein